MLQCHFKLSSPSSRTRIPSEYFPVRFSFLFIIECLYIFPLFHPTNERDPSCATFRDKWNATFTVFVKSRGRESNARVKAGREFSAKWYKCILCLCRARSLVVSVVQGCVRRQYSHKPSAVSVRQFSRFFVPRQFFFQHWYIFPQQIQLTMTRRANLRRGETARESVCGKLVRNVLEFSIFLCSPRLSLLLSLHSRPTIYSFRRFFILRESNLSIYEEKLEEIRALWK